MAAVNWVLLTYVVVRLLPPHLTTELEMKFDPFTVSVNPAPPAVALVGEMEVSVGTGFWGGGGVPPPPPPPQPARTAITSKLPAKRSAASLGRGRRVVAFAFTTRFSVSAVSSPPAGGHRPPLQQQP